MSVSDDRALSAAEPRQLLAGDGALAQLAEFLRLNVADGDAAENTVAAYLSHIRAFMAWCEERGVNPAMAGNDDVLGYRRDLATAGYARSTIGAKLNALRRLFDAASWHGLRSDNPAAGVRAPRDHTSARDRILERYLSPHEVQQLLNAPDWSPTGIRDRAIMALMYYHGLRVSEVAALTLDSITPGEHPRLQIRHGKGSRDRGIVMIRTTRDIVDRWLIERHALATSRSKDALFLSVSRNGLGTALTAPGVRYLVNLYLVELGIYRNGVSCHALRHAHAAHALASGANLAALMHELGHSSIDTTSVYTHVVDAIAQNPAEYL